VGIVATRNPIADKVFGTWRRINWDCNMFDFGEERNGE
jgi:hypothetical protein